MSTQSPRPVMTIEGFIQTLRYGKPDHENPAADEVLSALLENFDSLKREGATDQLALSAAVLQVCVQRLNGLRKQIDELRNDSLRYRGVWRPSTYDPGSLVQRQGGLWLCLKANSQMPPSSGWRLVVKRGSLHEAQP